MKCAIVGCQSDDQTAQVVLAGFSLCEDCYAIADEIPLTYWFTPDFYTLIDKVWDLFQVDSTLTGPPAVKMACQMLSEEKAKSN